MLNLILSSSQGQVIPKTIKFVASPPSTQLEGVRAKTARNQPVEKCTDISVTLLRNVRHYATLDLLCQLLFNL